MRVGIFVQAYNTEAFVGECLESILTQRGRYDVDVLVIDDASTDGTAREIARFVDPRLRVIRHASNAGTIATANEGYSLLSADAVLRIDSDDRLRPDFLVKTVPQLSDPEVGFVYTDVATIDGSGRLTCGGGLVRRDGRPACGNEFVPLLMSNFVPAPSTLVRRQALLPLLPIPLEFRFLDWYLTTGVSQRWKSSYVDEVLAEYRVHSGNMHTAMILDRRGEATSVSILQRLFADDHRRDEKRRWRRRVYGSHYLTYADKYFGCGLTGEARRCYMQAMLQSPGLLLEPRVVRRFMASVIGRRFYDAAKDLFHGRVHA